MNSTSGLLHSREEAMVWKGMETACRLALIYRWSPPAKSNKSQHYGPLNSEESSGPKEWEQKKEGEERESYENDTPHLQKLARLVRQ